MVDLDDARDALVESGEVVEKQAKRFWNGFLDFALQDNVLEVAVGLILGAAFTTLVTTFVSDILLPPLSLLPFINRNMDEKFAVLRHGQTWKKGAIYNTLQQALDDGAVVLAYGAFLNKVINFIGVGIALYSLALAYDYFTSDSIIKITVKCKYCRKRISEKATRCVNCTSWQDGREEKLIDISH